MAYSIYINRVGHALLKNYLLSKSNVRFAVSNSSFAAKMDNANKKDVQIRSVSFRWLTGLKLGLIWELLPCAFL